VTKNRAMAKTLTELASTNTRTQELVRGIAERLTTIEHAAREQLADRAYWYVVRVKDDAMQLASWVQPKRITWTADPMRATGFREVSGAYTAVKRIKATKGEAVRLMRIIL